MIKKKESRRVLKEEEQEGEKEKEGEKQMATFHTQVYKTEKRTVSKSDVFGSVKRKAKRV